MPLLAAPPARPLFTGMPFRDVLEERYISARAAVYRLELDAWLPVEGVTHHPALALVNAFDPALASLDWDAPSIDVGTTEDQQARAVIRIPFNGDHRALTYAPTHSWIGGPRVAPSLGGDHIALTVTAPTLQPEDMNRAITEARRFTTAHLEFLWEERAEWRPGFARRIRDAVNRRHALLEGLPEVEDL